MMNRTQFLVLKSLLVTAIFASPSSVAQTTQPSSAPTQAELQLRGTSDMTQTTNSPILSTPATPGTGGSGPASPEQPPALRGGTQPTATTNPLGQSPLDYGLSSPTGRTTINDTLSSPANPGGTGLPKSATRPYQVLSTSIISATAKLLDVAPLMRCRDDRLKFVEITLRNDSREVALVHGDIAEAKVSNNLRTAASARYIGTVAKPKLNNKGRIYTGLVLAGSWGLAGPMFYELVTPNQHAKRYLGTAIGVDGSRHEIEDQRFGLRVLMPGEETVGWLAFECPVSNDLTSLLIPVNYSKSALPSGSLFVPIQHGSAAKPPVADTSAPPAVQPSATPATQPSRTQPSQPSQPSATQPTGNPNPPPANNASGSRQ